MPAHVELTEKVGQIDEIKFFFIGELGIAPGSFHLSYFLFFCITMYTILFIQAGSKKKGRTLRHTLFFLKNQTLT